MEEHAEGFQLIAKWGEYFLSAFDQELVPRRDYFPRPKAPSLPLYALTPLRMSMLQNPLTTPSRRSNCTLRCLWSAGRPFMVGYTVTWLMEMLTSYALQDSKQSASRSFHFVRQPTWNPHSKPLYVLLTSSFQASQGNLGVLKAVEGRSLTNLEVVSTPHLIMILIFTAMNTNLQSLTHKLWSKDLWQDKKMGKK